MTGITSATARAWAMSSSSVLLRIAPRLSKPALIAKLGRERRFMDSLLGLSTNAGDAHQRCVAFLICPAHLLGGQFEHRLEQADLLIANLELRRVYANRKPTRAGGDVVARQCALATLIELAVRRQGQRVRGYRDTAPENLTNCLIHLALSCRTCFGAS